jgi:hypothetical protein
LKTKKLSSELLSKVLLTCHFPESIIGIDAGCRMHDENWGFLREDGKGSESECWLNSITWTAVESGV